MYLADAWLVEATETVTNTNINIGLPWWGWLIVIAVIIGFFSD